MPQENRKKQSKLRKKSRLFYFFAIIAFASLALINLSLSLYDGFTDERVALLLLNSWFTFYAMSIVTAHFKREDEQAFWHNWVVFSKQTKQKSNAAEKSNETTPCLDDKKKAS